eukprot:CAMPEP_0197246492 /NCGR_PEP_ID=MMETSP1429-20130617/12936_1 /TAXON_ID=49237 /ORGANISM="Chaetoceros  sp., Strain UNC1202" /LENGTH=164 /DNA_ID=CAMNT_0042707155 /DNA_START=23 /DNA_END=517 /DNA_ORIENTATION=+
MKTTSALIIAGCATSASAFAPSSNGARVATNLSAKEEKPSLFRTIFDMDLFKDKADQNDYGARSKKNVTVGKLGSKSYIPSGMSKEQFEKIRAGEAKKKDANYQRNVKKAGVFEDYTEFYMKRGTDSKDDWKKDINLGHRMAKTKYDWSGDNDKPIFGRTKGSK